MLTNNHYAFLKNYPLSIVAENVRKTGIPVVTKDNVVRYLCENTSKYPSAPRINTISGGYVHFGRGTTAPTINDYTLESVITSGISISTSYSSGSDQNGKIYSRYIYTLTNTSANDITIGELGGFVSCSNLLTAQNSTSRASGILMVFRETFTPIILPSGQSVAITLTMKLDEVIVTT